MSTLGRRTVADHDTSLLQLQYLTNSIGLRRNYLDENVDEAPQHDESVLFDVEGLIKPIALRSDTPIVRPDIAWHPNYETYLAQGFPAQISSPRVWSGADFADSNTYIVHLSDSDIAEINSALANFHALGDNMGPDDVATETFPLPNLRERLLQVSRNLHLGTGFNVIRGLNPTEYSPLDNVLIYLGITSYLADIRGCQDYDGRMIVHIKDIEKELPDATGRPSPYTSRAQPFHTDMCDILSMYVLDTAVSGGESLLASSGMIYNELAATRPDIIHVLSDNTWIHDDFNKARPSWAYRQLLHNFPKHGPSFLYSRRPLTGAPFSPHHPDVSAMSERQAEALDAVHFTAVKHQLKIALQPGDVEIFNNLALFHAREGFTDSGRQDARDIVDDSDSFSPTKRSLNGTRHMLRLWLRSSDEELAWPMPKVLEKNSELIYRDSEAKRLGKWDVHRAPTINRKLTRHFKCS
ncbi:hypothetical protein COCMIDRAFT_40948 [Bipolaris oryzae ATCC 44560]|uniref:TauD/TfdA-like domain-containing protein n=1 Tax=Bipolaris oryzae ATCC 44560 TaxID=930090 RepID=W6YZ16_COCMI|nr:uncharacterized protein COCMIDRAFT_40948 [Bipolaris oryzae ATCC 44560]EUC40779.1 hypothetical protein COCMIDRAFT_40948 [Bipolaris oryzae ATCC 44560]